MMVRGFVPQQIAHAINAIAAASRIIAIMIEETRRFASTHAEILPLYLLTV